MSVFFFLRLHDCVFKERHIACPTQQGHYSLHQAAHVIHTVMSVTLTTNVNLPSSESQSTGTRTGRKDSLLWWRFSLGSPRDEATPFPWANNLKFLSWDEGRERFHGRWALAFMVLWRCRPNLSCRVPSNRFKCLSWSNEIKQGINRPTSWFDAMNNAPALFYHEPTWIIIIKETKCE